MLKGFLCMETKKLDEDRRQVSFEECIACAETTENACNFTAALLRMLAATEEKEEITVTSTLGCLRNTYLRRKYDYFSEPTELYWLFRGKLAHKVIEEASEGEETLLEATFKKKLDGIDVYGTPDIIFLKKKLIRDYKTCAEVPKYRQDKPYSNHIQQLNLYTWLVSGQTSCTIKGKEVTIKPVPQIKRLQVIYMDMKNVKTTDSPVYSNEKVEEFLRQRVPPLKNALDNGLVPPKEDTWQCSGYCSVVSICHRLEKEEWIAERRNS